MWRIPATLLTVVLVGGSRSHAGAQDLEPRAYAATPTGTMFVVLAAGRSSGGVFFDPSLHVEDVQATLGAATVGLGYTFDFFSRTALVVGTMPYARGTASGSIQESTREATRTGWADARLKLSVNLLGGRARRPREFVKARRSPIVGLSVTTVLPVGQYHRDRLMNLGSNRWAWKPEAGLSIPVGRWTIETYGGVWLFAANDHFYPGGKRREQAPIVALQQHVSYTLRPRLWMAFDATWYAGGATTIDGTDRGDLQRNTRLGATMSCPIGVNQSLKVAYSTGATTRIGGDFNTLALAWQIAWSR
jgi:hypothetical protein